MNDTAARIGIYWLHDGQVLGLSCPASEAEPGVPGLLDSAFTHVDAWPAVRSDARLPAHLAYDAVPRGRVMYRPAHKRWLVYGDGQLLGCSAGGAQKADDEEVRARIAAFFGFDPNDADWRHDAHYTVGSRRIGRLMDE